MTCSAKDEVKIQKAKDPGLIHIHAELLPNIRQITVVVALPSEQNDTTTVTISSDSQSLSVAHGVRFTDLKLPAPVRHGFVPNIEARSTRDVSLRLPIAHIPNGLDPLALDTASNALWSAPSMTPDTEVSCRICHASIVKETVNTWKDLPSENWAEMMDFWHCHKPDTDDAPEYGYSSSSKGYDAANSIGPTLGIALVDATCFHLLQADCNVQLGVNPAGKRDGERLHSVHCMSCKTSIGAASNTDPEQVKLYKWEVSLRNASSVTREEYPEQRFIAAQLLSMIESQGVHRFVLHNPDASHEDQRDDSTGILLWIFNPDMFYSSTFMPESPKRAMKVYYKPRVINPLDVLEQEGSKASEVKMPIQSLRQALYASTRLLPASATTFQQWAVGFLER